jgi:NTE family protein
MEKEPHYFSCLLMALLLLVLPAGALGAKDGSQSSVQRPKIGLALSGGGARGAAHVGVLRVLEELRIPVDHIAGTSMGSIIAGLYASGMTLDEIEHALITMDWEHIFDDDPPREELSFRRKRDDDLYLIKAKPGIKAGELKFPAGLIQGQKFDLALRELTLPVAAVNDFDRLTIPFRAVASDIGTGEEVVLASGDLAKAMRASMAVPGAFAPAQIDGRVLVDGGITNNLPVSVVRDMGADIVIAVDISTPLASPDEVQNVLQITAQLTSIMTRTNTERQIASLTKRDILIVPNLGDITSADFTRAGEAIPAGAAAAEAARPQLVRLSLSESAYQAHLAARILPSGERPIVHFVQIKNDSDLADQVLRERLHMREGEPLDRAQLEKDISNIYGLELFETIDYRLIEEDGKTGVLVDARARSWGPDYLQFGLQLSSDFEGDSTYNFSLAYLKTAINELGGEVRLTAQLGQDPSIGVDWYQPLDYDSRYFFEPKIGYGASTYTLYTQGGNDKIAEYRVEQARLELAAGRELSEFGEARLGYRYATGDVDLDVGSPRLPEGGFDSGSVFGRLSVDRLDNSNFPSKGYRGDFEYELFRGGLGNDEDFDQLKVNLNVFETFGAHTFGLGGEFNTTIDGSAEVQNLFQLGGFLNLSGFNNNALSGQHSAKLAGVYYKRFTQLKFLPWYIGGSLELGNVWEDRDDISADSAIISGSVFLGADTPIGPFYTGYGYAEGGNSSLFLFLGKAF